MKRILLIVTAVVTALATVTCSPAPAEAHDRAFPTDGVVRCQALGICPPAPTGREFMTQIMTRVIVERARADACVSCSGLAPTTGFVRHLVRPGDTLWSISLRYYGTGHRWWELAARNGIADPRDLRAGSTVLVVFS